MLTPLSTTHIWQSPSWHDASAVELRGLSRMMWQLQSKIEIWRETFHSRLRFRLLVLLLLLLLLSYYSFVVLWCRSFAILCCRCVWCQGHVVVWCITVRWPALHVVTVFPLVYRFVCWPWVTGRGGYCKGCSLRHWRLESCERLVVCICLSFMGLYNLSLY